MFAETMPNRTVGYFINQIRKTHKLSPKEANILILRLKRKKLKSIGRKYKVSYERIRQIEDESLTKLDKSEFQDRLF